MTNYVGFYSTLWFSLIHEILHVVFDWEEIKTNTYAYHLSDDDNPDLSVKEKEAETNKYARHYLFSEDKAKKVKPYLNDISYVKEFAMDNQVHQSLIYAFNAFDNANKDRMAWPRARRYDGDLKECIKPVDYPWNDPKPIGEFIKGKKVEIYN